MKRLYTYFISCNKNNVRTNTVVEENEQLRKENDEYFKCFYCLHVRTGVIIFGFLQIILYSLVSVSLINSMSQIDKIHRDILSNINSMKEMDKDIFNNNFIIEKNNPFYPKNERDNLIYEKNKIDLSDKNDYFVVDKPPNIHHDSDNYRMYNFTCIIFLVIILITVVFLSFYAVFRNIPSHLLPNFFLVVFEFCLSFLGSICFLYDYSHDNIYQTIIEATLYFPFKEQFTKMDAKYIMFIFLLFIFFIQLIRAYHISILYRCYKFLLNKIPNTTLSPSLAQNKKQMFKVDNDLPNYDTIMEEINSIDYQKNQSGHLFYPETPPPTYKSALTFQNEKNIGVKPFIDNDITNEN